MESDGVLFYSVFQIIWIKSNLVLLSQLLKKDSTKLDSTRKVNHSDILVKLGQKGFPNKDFQSEAQIPSSISTDAERFWLALYVNIYLVLYNYFWKCRFINTDSK